MHVSTPVDPIFDSNILADWVSYSLMVIDESNSSSRKLRFPSQQRDLDVLRIQISCSNTSAKPGTQALGGELGRVLPGK